MTETKPWLVTPQAMAPLGKMKQEESLLPKSHTPGPRPPQKRDQGRRSRNTVQNEETRGERRGRWGRRCEKRKEEGRRERHDPD